MDERIRRAFEHEKCEPQRLTISVERDLAIPNLRVWGCFKYANLFMLEFREWVRKSETNTFTIQGDFTLPSDFGT